MVSATGAVTGELVGMMATELYHKDASQLTEGEKETVSTLATLAAGLAGGLAGDSSASALASAQTGKTVVENNLLAPSEYSALSKALDDFDKGKNPLEAAKQIVSLTNKDNVTDGLLYQLQQGKPLSEQDKRSLASALDQYGYELQTKYGYTEQQALAAIEKVKAGEAIVAPAADVATYNKARAYLINYGIQSGQAAVGTDALLALPGNLGTILRSTVAAGGAYQAGTGVGQLIEGQNVDGLINAGLGTAAIFGSVAANKMIGSTGAAPKVVAEGGIGVAKTAAEAKAEAVAKVASKAESAVIKTANASNAAHNAAMYAGLKIDLKTTQAANEVVESLRNTGNLPPNYLTKEMAMGSGWKPGKALNNSVPNGQIGGDVFKNESNLLPSAQGRTWHEADVGLDSKMSRGNQPGTRLLYSSDGLLYITTDHYNTATSIGKWK
ncbi:VENN motif pre-toxin domain-containing protein [Aeromonas dhakensis]|uniref:VENN motif pre-toxin domain-containing protein n=1 Tax=Aeromonas dhakensis TaxID=196024 RepID=UPI003BA0234B